MKLSNDFITSEQFFQFALCHNIANTRTLQVLPEQTLVTNFKDKEVHNRLADFGFKVSKTRGGYNVTRKGVTIKVPNKLITRPDIELLAEGDNQGFIEVKSNLRTLLDKRKHAIHLQVLHYVLARLVKQQSVPEFVTLAYLSNKGTHIGSLTKAIKNKLIKLTGLEPKTSIDRTKMFISDELEIVANMLKGLRVSVQGTLILAEDTDELTLKGIIKGLFYAKTS